MIEYTTTCPTCGDELIAEIFVEPEQAGGLETEYLPEYWGLDSSLHCSCGYEFTDAEEAAVLGAARRELGQ